MTEAAWATTLPCGTEPYLLLAAIADDDRTVDHAHVASCPHCQSALRSFGPRLATLRAVTAERPSVPPRVEQRVQATIRELRAGGVVEAHAAGAGRTTVAVDVVASLVRPVIEAVAGVRTAQVTATGSTPDLSVQLVIDGTRSVPELARDVRSEVGRAAGRHLGRAIRRVDVAVVDLG